jgi:Winged helix-turn helix
MSMVQAMVQAARKVTAKDANEKLAHRRLTVLELAERLGNVSEACRRGGIDRTSFYDWKRRFQLEGLDGLRDLPPIAKSHPMTTAPEVAARIEALALTHPAYGCNKIEALLAREGRRVSAITVQKTSTTRGSAPATSGGWPWSGGTPRPPSSSPPSRRRSWRSSTPASASGMSRANGRASCSRPTPSWWAP